jgi:hypothetical protein
VPEEEGRGRGMIRIIVHEEVLEWETHGLLESFTTLIDEIDFVG